MPSDLRPTIGFLSANIHIGSSRVLWPGIIDAAQTHDANLICYPGGRLHAAEEYEAERNIIYQFVNTDHLDGLVSWTSALAGTATSAEVASLHQHYQPLPIVSLAWPLEQGSLVSINGYQGMHALVSHLVDVHSYRRIALIRGPESHPYALERYHAYLDALKEKGLNPDPALIAPSLGWQKGAQAMRALLDERQLIPGQDFQAVVAVSDLLAIGAINMMAERGIRVPGDVAVVGFNDIEEGRLVRPALTSVSLPFYEQGRQAVTVLMNLLVGQEAPEQIMLDSQLLVRQSCGCPSQSVNLAAVEPGGEEMSGGVLNEVPDVKQALKRTQEELMRQIAQVISNRGVAATWAKQLVDAFRTELEGGTGSRFRSALDGMLQQGVLDGDETAAWQGAISVLRRELLPVLNATQQLRAEGLFGQARVVIGEAIQRAQIVRQLHGEHQNHLLRDIGQALITTFEVDRLADVLAERLPDLGIESCYLALYETPENIEYARLKLAFVAGHRVDLEPDGRRFPSHQLIPPDLLPERRYALLVEPLYFQTEPLGFVLFEIGPRDGAVYEVLRGHISSALKGALLFQETRAARLVAERSDQIKTRLLANVSHELRTPLNIIIGHTQRLSASPVTLSPGLAQDLAHIQHSAEHQLRLINDLLDLSRAEINALDLYPVLLDPRPLLEEAFVALAEDVAAGGAVSWRLDLPPSLPVVYADPVRLRQMLLNLLSNAARFTPRGQITLGAEALPSHLHVWVADTGIGISPELAGRIYDPFFTHEQGNQPPGGIGLGLAITKHLVALHEGRLTVESEPERGSTFHVYLPLPEAGEQVRAPSVPTAVLWFISQRPNLPPAVTTFSTERQLRIRRIGPQDNVEMLLADELPVVIAWDVVHTLADDWQLVRRLHNHPRLSQTPFVLYQPDAAGEEAMAGLTSLVVKPASSQALWAAIQPALPGEMAHIAPGAAHTVRGSVLVVDDDPPARARAVAAVEKGLPEHGVRTAVNGADGLAAALADPPDLIILDLMMPAMDGFDVLEQLRTDERTRQIPVIILSGRQLTLADVKRLERFTAVTLHNKGVLTPDEIAASLHRALFDDETLPPQTSALVRQAIAYLHQNYGRSLTRREIAAELGMSEDYLSRAFSQELGLSPWDYLNRYRVAQARDLLRHTPDSVTVIGRRVGFQDPAYFSRVFRRIVGVSPNAYRQGEGG